MQTHRFRQGPFPYCLVSSLRPEEEGREVGRHATLSPGLREEGSWDLLLATCQPAGSSSASYQGRDSTSVSRPGWGQQPQLRGRAWPCGLGLLREVAQDFLFPGANYRESPRLSLLPDELAAGSPLHPTLCFFRSTLGVSPSFTLHLRDKDFNEFSGFSFISWCIDLELPLRTRKDFSQKVLSQRPPGSPRSTPSPNELWVL